MRVLITGGAGLIGRAAAKYLRERDWEVYIIDLVLETDVPDVSYATCDIMNYEQVFEQMRGCDAVVHMAALRSPLHAAGQEVYRINTVGTFNVFEAAAKHGIRRVVQASSINAIGCHWSLGDFAPHYLPVDEAHPVFTTDPYSFSKQQIEEIGAYFWRRDGISSVALRFPGVYSPNAYQTPQAHERWQAMCQFIDDFANQSEDKRQAQLATVHQACIAFRVGRNMEYPNKSYGVAAPAGIDPLLWRAYTFERYNLWAALDERDAAQSIERSLTADFTGSHALFVNDDHNTLDYDSQTLARIFFPHTHDIKPELTGSKSLFSIQHAQTLIGFKPQHPLYRAFIHGDNLNND